jgi:hypothetical protein
VSASISGWPVIPRFVYVPRAESHRPSSADGSRCNVPRIAQSFTSVRRSQSASLTASRSSPSMRARRLSSARRHQLRVQTADLTDDTDEPGRRNPLCQVMPLQAPCQDAIPENAVRQSMSFHSCNRL